MPVLLILLLVIFGSLAAAALPPAIGGIGILGSFTALRLLTLGTRCRLLDQHHHDPGPWPGDRLRLVPGRPVPRGTRPGSPSVRGRAVARTIATAGRTVAVSGITVAMALCSLMLFPEVFLRSMGYGGVATVLVDMLAALTVLPALLAVLGPRVNALRIRRAVGQAGREERRLVPAGASVMRRPSSTRPRSSSVLLVLARRSSNLLGRHRRPRTARQRRPWGGSARR